ncbi:MAG: MtnX-like HAD-IB family phosphatase [Alicyclobacillus sp.]|nr:MtnX-like HAD-IB family phosphatase [Alicyclobacillus sp.]
MPVGLFCDFDGTIAQQDMIGKIVLTFAPNPSEAQSIIDEVNARTLSVRVGVERMFSLIPSAKLPEMAAFARDATRIRPGFPELVAEARSRGWLFVVVSGGFDFFVQPALAPYIDDHVPVFCNRMDATGPFLRVVWQHPCDAECRNDCGLCKPSVLRSFSGRVGRRIVIGDGVTDFAAAQLADFVFARDKLLQLCVEHGLPHAPFDTFHDIVRALDGPFQEA